jgi:polar amino acid transport system substrate-binding protein
VDIAIGDLTITQDRMQLMDFTQPYFDSGLRLMINQDRQSRFGTIMKKLYDGGHLHVFMWLGIIILAAFWLLCGVTVVAYVTSSITAVMTVASLNDQIHSSADLNGNSGPVGVVEGSAAEAWSLNSGLPAQTFTDLPAAVHALLRTRSWPSSVITHRWNITTTATPNSPSPKSAPSSNPPASASPHRSAAGSPSR